MSSKPLPWKDVIDRRRKQNFVGRADQLHLFSDNFVGDMPTYMLFAVTGEGGVGKSTLLNRYKAIVTSPGIGGIAIRCDEHQSYPVAAMSHIAEKLAERGITHKDFADRLTKYHDLQSKLGRDEKAPRGGVKVMSMGLSHLVLKTAKGVPGIGAFVDGIDTKAAGEALAGLIDYAIDRGEDKDAVDLLSEPERQITPHFLELLAKACEHQKVVLMFDVFEQTCDTISSWLLALLNFEYGEFSTNLTFVISGRDQLEQHWTELAIAVCHVSLEPFTLNETRLYLSNRGTTDERLVSEIFDATGGLPVLVELLVATNPKPGVPLPDVSDKAVARFLQWTPQQENREVALRAAVPRQFNRDILGAVLGAEIGNRFDWLTEQSYIRTTTDRGWFYHEKVRELMLRYLRNISPQDLANCHVRLMQYFEAEQKKMDVEGKVAIDSKIWRRQECERIYHAVSAQPDKNVSYAINSFLYALRRNIQFTRDIALASLQAAHDTGLPVVKECADTLYTLYQAYDKDDLPILQEKLAGLENRRDLTKAARCGLYSCRGVAYGRGGEYDKALADFDRAIALDDTYTWAITNRGETYRRKGEYDKALADFNRAITLNDTNAWAIARRGETYRLKDEYDKALADFDRAIALDATNAWAIASRGVTYRLKGEYDKALADFDRAIALDATDVFAISSRGVTYRLKGEYDKALADFDRAIALDDTYTWAIANRGETYRLKGEYDKALADFNRAITLNDTDAWAIARRGETYRLKDEYDKALADFDRAIALDATDVFAITSRGYTYQLKGEYDKALADSDRAIALDDTYTWAITNRGYTYQLEGEYDKALADFDRAIALDDTDVFAITSRGYTYQLKGEYDKALADFDRAIALDATYSWAITNRGYTYQLKGEYDKALADFDRAIALDATYTRAIINRGYTYRLKGEYDKALADFDRAIALNATYTWAITSRGYTYRLKGEYDKALADFDRAIALDATDVFAITNRGVTYRLKGEYDKALADFDRAITLNDTNAWAIARRGEIYRRKGEYDKALADFDRAITLDDTSVWTTARRAAVLLSLGNITDAQTDLNKATTLSFENTDDFYGRAVALVLINQFLEALDSLEQAIRREKYQSVEARDDDLFEPIRNMPKFQELISLLWLANPDNNP